MAFCSRCGRVIEPSEQYCSGCGAKVSPAAMPPVISTPYVPTPEKTRSGLRFGKLIIAVVILVIIVTGAIAFSQRGPGSSNSSSSGSGGNNGGSNNKMEFTAWKGSDPWASNTGAFKMLIPKGWTATGGVMKYYYPYGGSDFNFTAKDSSGKSSIFFAMGDFPQIIEPSSFTRTFQQCFSPDLSSIVSCGEDTWWLPANYIGLKGYVHSYMTATDYVRAYSSSQIGFTKYWRAGPITTILNTVHPDVSIQSTTENTHLKDRIVDLTLTDYSGVDALFTYTESGSSYKMALQLLVARSQFDIQGYHFAQWSTFYWGYSAPVNDFNVTGKAYSAVLPTMRVDAQWLQAELQRQSQVTILLAQHLQRIMQLQYSLITSLSESAYQTGMGWINTLGGSESAYNPADPNTVYNVSFMYTYWFDCGGGDLIGTNDANFQTTCASMKTGNLPPGQ